MAAIFNFSLIRTLDIVRGSLVVLPDLKNMSMAVGLSMLSCTQANMDVISYQLFNAHVKSDVEASNTRIIFSKWFVSCQHLELKLNNNSKSRDYVRLNLAFSSNFELTELKNYCDREMEVLKLKLKLERKLTLAKIKECLKLTNQISAMMEDMHECEQILILRAFRAVILANKSIARELISFIPIGPTYRPIARPDKDYRVNLCRQKHQQHSA